MKTLTIVLLALSTVLFSQDILFEDDFNDGDALGWIIVRSEGNYFVNDSLRYDISYDGPDQVPPTVARGDSASLFMTVQDYSVLAECIPHLPSLLVGVGVMYSLGDYGYICCLWPEGDKFYIWRLDGILEEYVDLGSANCSIDWDESYWVRFECEGDTLRANVWQDPDPEPAEWMLIVSDTTYINNGCVVLYATNVDGIGPAWAEFDNVVVTTISPGALEQSTWALIKSSF